MAGRVVIAVLAGLMLSAQTPAPSPSPQDAPPIVVIGPDADIVVTGGRPVIRGGLWQLVRSPTIGFGGAPGSRGFRFTTCLADGALEEAIHTLAGDRSALPRGRICGSVRLRLTNGRINGGRSCMTPSLDMGTSPKVSRLDLTGRFDSRRLTLNFLSDDEFDGMAQGGNARQTGQRWRAEADRIGDCPAVRRLDQRTTEQAVRQLFDPVVTPDAD